MAEKLSIGNIVVLKSGGADMTVYSIGKQDGEPYVKCLWHDMNFQPQSDTYHPNMLTKLEKPRK